MHATIPLLKYPLLLNVCRKYKHTISSILTIFCFGKLGSYSVDKMSKLRKCEYQYVISIVAGLVRGAIDKRTRDILSRWAE